MKQLVFNVFYHLQFYCVKFIYFSTSVQTDLRLYNSLMFEFLVKFFANCLKWLWEEFKPPFWQGLPTHFNLI